MRNTLVPELTIGAHVIDSPFHIPILRVSLREKEVAGKYAVNLEEQFNKSIMKSMGGSLPRGASKTLSNPSLLCWNLIAHFSSASFFGDVMCDNNDELLGIFVSLHLSCFKVINAAAVMPKWIAKFAATDIETQKNAIRRMVGQEVERRRANPGCVEEGSDVLSNVLKAKDPTTGEEVTSDKVGDYMVSVIFASMSTTAGVLTHVVFDLAGRPEQAAVLREETAKALNNNSGGGNGGKVDENFLTKVPKLTAFIRESVRLASLPIQGVRWSMKDIVLESDKGSSLNIPAGCLVTNSGILAHYDEEVFEDAMKFDSGRFLEQPNGKKLIEDPSKMGFSPFGTGRHVCPGRHFAMAEVHVAAALLLQEFDFKTTSGEVPKYKFVATETLRWDEDVEFVKR
jgi:cytochrome P450